MSLKLYQMVKVEKDFECIQAGAIGQIFAFDEGDAGVRFGEESEFTHAIGGHSDNYDGYWIPTDLLVPIKVKRLYEIPKEKLCCKCGRIVKENQYEKIGEKFLCKNCASIKCYSTKNDKVMNKPTKSGKTYGFEFECVCDKNNRNFVTAQNWGLIPTSDGSLPYGGVEFKTPTYNGLRGIRKVFNTMNSKVDFSDYRCGQHINIGDKNWLNSENMQIIRENRTAIFNKLRIYMFNHPKQTEKVVGRTFGNYRNNDMSMVHGSWINLEHNNRIEFRMSKFVNTEQYFGLTMMWTEMIDAVIKNVLKKSGSERDAGCLKASDELVEIFKKHYNSLCS